MTKCVNISKNNYMYSGRDSAEFHLRKVNNKSIQPFTEKFNLQNIFIKF